MSLSGFVSISARGGRGRISRSGSGLAAGQWRCPYCPVASRYLATTSAGTRPRSLMPDTRPAACRIRRMVGVDGTCSPACSGCQAMLTGSASQPPRSAPDGS